MKKLSGILFVSLAVALTATLFFACSGGAGGSDDTPTNFPITIVESGEAGDDAVTANVARAVPGETITLTASLGAGRRVALSAEGLAQTLATISADGETVTFPMPAAAVIITATFSDIPSTEYAITITPTGATGSEEVTADVTEATEGTTITLTASLGTGRRVALSADGLTITPATISANGGVATFTMPGNAVEVTAAFSSVYPITVTYSTDDGTTIYATSEILSPNTTVGTLPADPAKTGHTFNGWYTAPNGGGTAFTATTTVADDITVYAKWLSGSVYTVRFDSQEGSAVPDQDVLSGGLVEEPAAPTRIYYDFTGWYTDQFCFHPWDFTNDTVSTDRILYAGWTRNAISLIFEYTITDEKVTITCYKGSDNDIEIPEVIEGYPVTCIGSNAFDSNRSLTSVMIPDSVTSIGDSAFSYCETLAHLTIPNSVTCIGEYAFNDCDSLTNVIIPDSVTSIGKGAFYDCRALASVTISGSVTSISDSMFANCGLTSVTIPDSVTSIGEDAFSRCGALTNVFLPDLLTSIGNNAFEYCRLLNNLTLPDSLISIGQEAFNQCESLTSVTIGNSVTTIGNSAFAYCYKITSITIGNSVKNLGQSTFAFCGLTDVTIPNSVTSIESGLFSNCSNLTNVTIGNSVTSIGEGALYNCDNLTNVTIPDSVTSIGDEAFMDCSNLINVMIPDSVTSIGNYAFSHCISLPSVIIPDSVTSIGEGAFSNCIELTNVVLPDLLTSISDNVFRRCELLNNLTLPDSVISIGEAAFSSCTSMTSVTIPDLVTSIDDDAFYGCSNLETVYVRAETPPVLDGEYAFDWNNPDRIIYVPASNDDSIINAYKAAEYWSEYSSAMQEYEY